MHIVMKLKLYCSKVMESGGSVWSEKAIEYFMRAFINWHLFNALKSLGGQVTCCPSRPIIRHTRGVLSEIKSARYNRPPWPRKGHQIEVPLFS
jgi:hypothetical protein